VIGEGILLRRVWGMAWGGSSKEKEWERKRPESWGRSNGKREGIRIKKLGVTQSVRSSLKEHRSKVYLGKHKKKGREERMAISKGCIGEQVVKQKPGKSFGGKWRLKISLTKGEKCKKGGKES